jgi:hypothetical protein
MGKPLVLSYFLLQAALALSITPPVAAQSSQQLAAQAQIRAELQQLIATGPIRDYELKTWLLTQRWILDPNETMGPTDIPRLQNKILVEKQRRKAVVDRPTPGHGLPPSPRSWDPNLVPYAPPPGPSWGRP